MNIQWFPGHMAKTRRQMEEKLKLIDAVVEMTVCSGISKSHVPDAIASIAGGCFV